MRNCEKGLQLKRKSLNLCLESTSTEQWESKY